VTTKWQQLLTLCSQFVVFLMGVKKGIRLESLMGYGSSRWARTTEREACPWGANGSTASLKTSKNSLYRSTKAFL